MSIGHKYTTSLTSQLTRVGCKDAPFIIMHKVRVLKGRSLHHNTVELVCKSCEDALSITQRLMRKDWNEAARRVLGEHPRLMSSG